MAIQLRFLQTVVEIAAENNSTTVFPIPMDLFTPILEARERMKPSGERAEPSSDPSKTLGPEGSENALPAGIDPTMLTDAAKSILGIGSGGSESDE